MQEKGTSGGQYAATEHGRNIIQRPMVGSCQNCLGQGLLRVSMKDNECEYSVILMCVESRGSFEKPVVR